MLGAALVAVKHQGIGERLERTDHDGAPDRFIRCGCCGGGEGSSQHHAKLAVANSTAYDAIVAAAATIALARQPVPSANLKPAT